MSIDIIFGFPKLDSRGPFYERSFSSQLFFNFLLSTKKNLKYNIRLASRHVNSFLETYTSSDNRNCCPHKSQIITERGCRLWRYVVGGLSQLRSTTHNRGINHTFDWHVDLLLTFELSTNGDKISHIPLK